MPVQSQGPLPNCPVPAMAERVPGWTCHNTWKRHLSWLETKITPWVRSTSYSRFHPGRPLFLKGIHRILDDHNAQRGWAFRPGYGAAVIDARFIGGNPYGHIDERLPFDGFLEIGPETIILVDETFWANPSWMRQGSCPLCPSDSRRPGQRFF